MTANICPTRPLLRYAFPAAVALILLLLLVRNHGLYPVVFLDEWSYSRYARLAPLSEAIVPSYLYLALFGATNACGTAFLECARVGNAVLYVLAAPFLYRVALPVTGRPAAIVVTLTALLGGSNTYTAYFMPEATYFLGFWVLSWIMLSEVGGTGVRSAVLAGVVLGLMSLVKVHALFLLPAIMLYALWRSWRTGRPATGVLAAAAMAATTLVLKLALGWLLAGAAGLDLLGSMYGGQARQSAGGVLARLLQPALWNAYGHLMALVLLCAVPLLALLTAAASAQARAAAGQPGRNALVYTVLTLGATLGLTVLYTASIAHAGPNEGARLHLRYYDFVFPLLAMLAASPLLGHRGDWRVRAALVLLLAALIVVSALTLRPAFVLSFVDGPELVNLAEHKSRFHQLVLLQLLVIAAWCWRPALGRLGFVWLLLPVMALNASVMSYRTLQLAAGPAQLADRVGRALHAQLSDAERDRLLLIGDDAVALFRAQFHVDRHASQTLLLAPGEAIDAAMVPPGVGTVVVLGDHALPPELAAQVVTSDYQLTRIGQAPAPARIVARTRFDVAGRTAALTRVQGLAAAEPWGAWSDGGQVVLEFARPFPRKMILHLTAQAYGPNIGAPFVLAVGEVRRTITLAGSARERLVQFDTDGRQRTLTIAVPHPARPAEIDNRSTDLRALGIGLIAIGIGEPTAP
ncbi:hypothetical protein ASF61_11490 [Duganella sp. Leaf126]|uniref:DUF7024 domain-containing protein n=1 Tax=Duganella sp. Leaf126 TaxID=1736266 RepID=UPI0006FBB03C|nr:hypothetical protein [Duganella sp. Leaf126]KQQ33674.1 hypothetical protein ASF61_11490 [Duganella sp. Leaf126]